MTRSLYHTDPLLKKVPLYQDQSLMHHSRNDFSAEYNYAEHAAELQSEKDDEPDFDCEFL